MIIVPEGFDESEEEEEEPETINSSENQEDSQEEFEKTRYVDMAVIKEEMDTHEAMEYDVLK